MRLSVFLIAGAMVLGANCFGAEETAATRKADAMIFTVAIPDTKWVLSVQYPDGWKEGKEDSGQRCVYEPGPGKDRYAQWQFAVKRGMTGREVPEVLEIILAGVKKNPDATLSDQKLVERADGKKAGIMEFALGGEIHMTIRDYFFKVDDDTLVIVTETSPTSGWNESAAELAKITASLKVEKK